MLCGVCRLAGLDWEQLSLDTLFVDPPRAGLDPATEQMLQDFEQVRAPFCRLTSNSCACLCGGPSRAACSTEQLHCGVLGDLQVAAAGALQNASCQLAGWSITNVFNVFATKEDKYALQWREAKPRSCCTHVAHRRRLRSWCVPVVQHNNTNHYVVFITM